MTGAVDDALVIVGGGQMGAALAAGIARRASAGGATGRLVVVEASAERRAALPVLLPSVSVVAELPACRDAIIAVKPADVVAVAAALGAHGARRVVSVAAGVTTAAIAAAAGPAVEVVRAMPNTPALVGEGATAIAPAAGCAAATLAWARGLMESVGRVVEVDERLMDAVTGVSGSGPAYVYMLAEALIDAAVAEGLAPRDADALVRQLLVGVAALWARDDSSPATLRQRVTSPNGTTAAAVAELDRSGFREIVARAVRAATARSRELGDTKP